MLIAAYYFSARDHDDIKLDDKLLTIDKNEFRSAGSKRITTKRFRCRNAECSGAASYYPLLDVFQTRHHEKCEHKKPSRAPARHSHSSYCVTLATF